MDVESSSSDVLSRFRFICNRNLFVCPCTTTLCLRLLICPVNVVHLINHLRELLIYFLPFIEARTIKQFKSHFRTLLLLLRQYHVCYPDAPVDFLSVATRIQTVSHYDWAWYQQIQRGILKIDPIKIHSKPHTLQIVGVWISSTTWMQRRRVLCPIDIESSPKYSPNSIS